MQKKNFVSMLLGTVGGILFAIGMCMCLLPEWGVFTQGIIIGAVGAVVLLAMLIVRRKMEGKPAVPFERQGGRSVLLGVTAPWYSALECAGLGLSMMIPGIL